MKNKTALRGQISLILIGLVTLAVLIGVTGMVLRTGAGSSDSASGSDTFKVRRGGFDITLPVSGELEALKQENIQNKLDGRAIIMEIVAEGTSVNAGDVVLKLNDEEVRTKERDAQDRVNMADAAHVDAQAQLEIQQKTQKAELDKADVAIKLAELSLSAWREGEAVTKLKELQLAVETADKEFLRLDERFKESERLLTKDFISKDEYKRDEISFITAKAELETAKLALQVYQDYEIHRDRAEKESEVDQAKSDRERVEKENDAKVRSALSDVESKKFQLANAKEKLSELQQQLAYCTVTAPAPGLVVYYASTQMGGMGRNEGRPPQVGTELSRNETVIILPDMSQMVAAVKVSEALVGQIGQGQHATITCDAMPDSSISGTVQSVGVLAESGGWRDPNRRDYKVRIVLNEGTDLGLKPSMRCKATIHVGRVDNALHVPIQSVFRAGPLAYVYVPQSGGFAQRKVTTGRASELYIEVTDGVEQNETVLLRQPQPEEIVSRLPVPKQEEQPVETNGPMNGPMGAGMNGAMPAGMNGGMNQGGSPMNPNGGARPQMPSNGPSGGGTGAGDGSGNRERPDGPRRGNRGGQRPEGESGSGRPDGGEQPAATSPK